MLYSEDDSVSRPSARLIELSIQAIIHAQRNTSMGEIGERMSGRFSYPDATVNLWPGEHYRLLAAFVQVLKPTAVVEIGTAEGLSALSMLKYLPIGGWVTTFDVVPWDRYPRSCLQPEDFQDGRLRQIVADLGEASTFEQHRAILSRADLIFIDAAKDGVLEHKLIANFQTVRFESRPLFVFDDIRLWNMLSVWRALTWPKLDLTSFGHWCGTGISEPIGDV